MAAQGDDEAESPKIGQPLPNADDPAINPDKLRLYALDAGHPVGRHKAAVFERALGIHLVEWEYLRDCIVEQLPRCPVTRVSEPVGQHDTYTWEVLVPIQGLEERADRRLLIITAWEMVAGRPDLVTVRVAPESRQRPA
jgi:hypothetical protein